MQKEQEEGKGVGKSNHIQREHADTLEAAKKKGSGPILQFFFKKDTPVQLSRMDCEGSSTIPLLRKIAIPRNFHVLTPFW
jgi:hypothetical protein